MTIDEKLEHFIRYCGADAKDRADKLLKSHEESLLSDFSVFSREEKKQADLRFTIEKESILREANKSFASRDLSLRRAVSDHRGQLEDKIFAELFDRLEHFMRSSRYPAYLEKKIREILDFGAGEDLVLYMDPADEALIRQLSVRLGVEIMENAASFMGGVQAMLPERNLFIDHSFAAKLAEAREGFRFELQEKQHG